MRGYTLDVVAFRRNVTISLSLTRNFVRIFIYFPILSLKPQRAMRSRFYQVYCVSSILYRIADCTRPPPSRLNPSFDFVPHWHASLSLYETRICSGYRCSNTRSLYPRSTSVRLLSPCGLWTLSIDIRVVLGRNCIPQCQTCRLLSHIILFPALRWTPPDEDW
jgi:hypothetical protein